jgi:hypothetical protein
MEFAKNQLWINFAENVEAMDLNYKKGQENPNQ